MGEHRMVVEQAWRMFRAGERDRAYRVADEVLANDPFDYRASELRLAQLMDHGALVEARRLCLQLQSANPVSAWLWEQRYLIAQGLADGGEMVAAGEAWLRSEPDEHQARLAIAEGHRVAGDDVTAHRVLQHGVEAQPDVAELHVALGDWHVEHGDHASARRAYREALDLEPDRDIARAGSIFDGYVDLTVKSLLASMICALVIAVPATLAIGGLWGGLVTVGLVGASFWAHWEWFARVRSEVPDRHLRGFVTRRRGLLAADVGALVAGVVAVALAFVTDLAAQQIGVAIVVAVLAAGVGVGLVRSALRR